jgi:CubicO group peptidase (beta-lactamase class C family)
MIPMTRYGFPFICFLLSVCTLNAQTPGKPQTAELPRATPESQGVSSVQVLKFIEAADKQVNSMHSFMLLRHGHVIAEAWWKPEAANKPHVLWSLSKSFTSTAIGFAVAENKLTIDDRVCDFFPDELPENPSEHLKAMRVRDLLTMSTGHDTEPSFRPNGPTKKGFLSHPVTHQPGTHFVYNTPATYMLSAIIQKVTGTTVLEYLRPRLFQPLGIVNPTWDESSEGISLGGYGLQLCTEDIAKFGQLYLQQGKWNDKQLLPSEWIELATSKQVSNGSDPDRDWTQGYGFQFWRSRHGAYRGDGKDGQFCVVIPEQDVVIAITANTADMQGELNLVWEHLLPAFHEQSLPDDAQALDRLRAKLGKLEATY